MTHNIIKTENYLLVVDDSEIKEGDWIYKSNSNTLNIAGKGYHNFTKSDAKITAHLPLNNSPVLEGVPLLPPLEDDEAINKAKEKYNADLGELLSNFYLFATNGEVCDHEVINEFIQSIQQSKTPVEFECESTQYTVDEMSKLPLGTVNQKPKTTTNSQGQTVWAGKYIY
jgi:hypothetical protein